MDTAAHYREKVGEMLRLAELSRTDFRMRDHWREMAKEWSRLAHQADMQDALVRRLFGD